MRVVESAVTSLETPNMGNITIKEGTSLQKIIVVDK